MKKKFILGIIASMAFIPTTWAQPNQNYCQHFNGSQIATHYNTAALDLSLTFTLETYIYLETASPYGIVLGKTFNPRANDPYQNYVISLDATGLKPEFIQTTGVAGSYTAATSPLDIPLNTWTHVAATTFNGQMKLYINGNLVATQNAPGIPSTNTGVPFAVGSGATPTFQTTCCGFTGNLMQGKVWNYALSAAEIQTNMNIQLNGSETGLTAYWPMDESSGQIIFDHTSNGYHLTRGTTQTADAQDPTPLQVSTLGPFFSYSNITLPYSSCNSEELFVLDYNNDNRQDLIAARLVWPPTLPASPAPMQCLKNNGGMSFTNDSPLIGYDSLVHPRDFTVADFNGDNRNDLFIADHGTDLSPFPGGQNKLFFQNSSGQLIESSAGNIPTQLDFTHNTCSADIDNDGDQDLYVCNIYGNTQVGPRLLINNGTGGFTVNTAKLPANIVNLTDVYMASRFTDIDNDGDKDLILGAIDNSGLVQDAVLINNGAGTFTLAPNALPNRYGNANWGTVSIAAADINNDGYNDLIMSTLYQYQNCELQLLVNNRNGTFSDSTQNITQNWPTTNAWIKWVETADFNNDGWMDFVVALFGAQPRLFLNRGNTKFMDASTLLTVTSNIASYRARDFDNDGLCDIAFLDFSGGLVIAKNRKPFAVEIDSSGLTTNMEQRGSMISKNAMTIYPVPSSNQTNIKFDHPIENGTLVVCNLLGEQVATLGNINGMNATFYRNTIPSGLYILNLYSQHDLVDRKKLIFID